MDYRDDNNVFVPSESSQSDAENFAVYEGRHRPHDPSVAYTDESVVKRRVRHLARRRFGNGDRRFGNDGSSEEESDNVDENDHAGVEYLPEQGQRDDIPVRNLNNQIAWQNPDRLHIIQRVNEHYTDVQNRAAVLEPQDNPEWCPCIAEAKAHYATRTRRHPKRNPRLEGCQGVRARGEDGLVYQAVRGGRANSERGRWVLVQDAQDMETIHQRQAQAERVREARVLWTGRGFAPHVQFRLNIGVMVPTQASTGIVRVPVYAIRLWPLVVSHMYLSASLTRLDPDDPDQRRRIRVGLDVARLRKISLAVQGLQIVTDVLYRHLNNDIGRQLIHDWVGRGPSNPEERKRELAQFKTILRKPRRYASMYIVSMRAPDWFFNTLENPRPHNQFVFSRNVRNCIQQIQHNAFEGVLFVGDDHSAHACENLHYMDHRPGHELLAKNVVSIPIIIDLADGVMQPPDPGTGEIPQTSSLRLDALDEALGRYEIGERYKHRITKIFKMCTTGLRSQSLFANMIILWILYDNMVNFFGRLYQAQRRDLQEYNVETPDENFDIHIYRVLPGMCHNTVARNWEWLNATDFATMNLWPDQHQPAAHFAHEEDLLGLKQCNRRR